MLSVRSRVFISAAILMGIAAFLPISASLAAPPPEETSDLRDGKAFTIPFTLSRGHIYVSVKVNGKPATFGLDTDAYTNVLTPEAAKRLGIDASETGKSTTAVGVGGVQKSWIVPIDSLTIGGASLTNSQIFVLGLPKSAKLDGLLGYQFLCNFVTSIDYQAKTVTFSAASSPKTGDVVLELKPTRGVPVVDVDIDGVRGRFQVDTGDGGSIEIVAKFAERNHLADKYPRHIDLVTGLGVGGSVRSSVVRLKTLKLGTAVLNNVAGNLSLQKTGVFAAGYFDGVIGYGILSRFKITLDYQAARVILTDAGIKNKPFDYNRSGVGFDVAGDGLHVTEIIPGGPGEQAGVIVGDEIVELNGSPVGETEFDRVTAAAQGAPGEKMRLKLRAADKAERDVTLTLRELI
ncbi:MAG: aspartyl protease family protein [Capsulimonas sp.]|uniref:aspartyl protease family protein n=1 Tax=Capsulimonas sp. TaxID=2494211 RepID=UPI003263EAAC